MKLHATYIEKLEKMREKKEYYEATFLLFTKAGLKQFGVLPYDDGEFFV